MSKIAYCNGCGRYVQLTEVGEVCPAAHPRSELRDVREGVIEPPREGAQGAQPYVDDGGLLAKVIGNAVVLVPVGLVVAWGLWTGYEQFGPGMPIWQKLGMSVVSLVTTVALAFLFAGRRGR